MADRRQARGWQKKRRNRAHHRPDPIPVTRPGLGDCPVCGKQMFTSKANARANAVILYPGDRMRVYPCSGWFHLTSQDAEVTAAHRDRLARQQGET